MFNRKKSKFVALTVFASILLIATLMASASAQAQATVTILASVGGTTTPGAGTTTDADGTAVSLSATADQGFEFQYWVITTSTGESTTDTSQSTTLTVTGGVTYTIQAVFQPIQSPPGVTQNPLTPTTDAVVGVLASAGGTTNPAPGLYYLANATTLRLTATPSSGWQFSHWVIYGPELSHGADPYTPTPTDNPYLVDHGYGNRYDYQAVFEPVGSTTPTPTIPEFSSVAVIVVALAFIAIAVGTVVYRRKTK